MRAPEISNILFCDIASGYFAYRDAHSNAADGAQVHADWL
jgi:hypothetical protein